MPLVTLSKAVGYTTAPRAARASRTAIGLLAGLGCAAAIPPATAETWKLSASASATETYTSNANYSASSLAQGDFVTSITGALRFTGEGARLKLGGSIAGTGTFYTGQTQNNSFAPQVNVTGTLEAIEKFAYLDAQAVVSQTFISPFGAQPADLVNATQNRYTQQTYAVSPYIKGVFGSSGISYQLRDDNYWTAASSFGNSSTDVPNTYSNSLVGSIHSPKRALGWTLEYRRLHYDNGINNAADIGQGSTTTQVARLLLPYQIDPQLEITARIGYEKDEFPLRTTQGVVYGIGGAWNPTDRTHVGGYWEHQFFGSAYSVQMSHRLPNAALSANASRGINSYPQLALAIPAGAAVTQFLDAAFTTRIPDPTAREQAVDQFLAQTQLPPTLASPVNFYATTLTLLESARLSLVLIGVRNSVGLSIFYSKSESLSAEGNVLPPAFQFGQNNTQRGVGANYAFSLSSFTNAVASASYSRTTVDMSTGPFANARSNNFNANVSLHTHFGPKTTGSAGIGYSWSDTPGSAIAGSTSSVSSLNVFATVSHTF